jgi:hypothetical protein
VRQIKNPRLGGGFLFVTPGGLGSNS